MWPVDFAVCKSRKDEIVVYTKSSRVYTDKFTNCCQQIFVGKVMLSDKNVFAQIRRKPLFLNDIYFFNNSVRLELLEKHSVYTEEKQISMELIIFILLAKRVIIKKHKLSN